MALVDVNGCQMFVESRGQGEPLLLLHGGMGIAEDWRLIFPTEPEGYRLVSPDLRGHGRSTNPAGHFTFRQAARDVLALLDELRLPRVQAIGLSLGAKTLLHVATMQPERVEAMVLVSATPRFTENLRTAAVQYSRAAFDQLSASEREALALRHVHGDEQIRLLYDMIRSFATSEGDMAFTPSQLHTITARTLIVHGDRDALYPVELAVELYRNIPRAALWIIPDADHSPIFGPLAPTFVSTALAHFASGRRSVTS